MIWGWRVVKVLWVIAALCMVCALAVALIPGGNWHADQNPSFSTD